jgi:hypothetical protein
VGNTCSNSGSFGSRGLIRLAYACVTLKGKYVFADIRGSIWLISNSSKVSRSSIRVYELTSSFRQFILRLFGVVRVMIL